MSAAYNRVGVSLLDLIELYVIGDFLHIVGKFEINNIKTFENVIKC